MTDAEGVPLVVQTAAANEHDSTTLLPLVIDIPSVAGNLGDNRDHEPPSPNNLLSFMYRISSRKRSLLLATATPVQLRPIEAWDLLDVLSRNDESVLGNTWSKWRDAQDGLDLIMGRKNPPANVTEQWDWVRNPLPPKTEHRDFEIIRGRLETPDSVAVVPGHDFERLQPPDRARIQNLFPRFAREHHPFIRRIIRRTREQLENQIDPETNEPLLQKVGVRLHGEDAVLPKRQGRRSL